MLGNVGICRGILGLGKVPPTMESQMEKKMK